MKIFVTGGTGFIGSHLVSALVAESHEVLVLRRATSSLHRCADFEGRVAWLNQDDPNWAQQVVRQRPSVIIHSAWSGVTASERVDWKLQAANLNFLAELLQIADAVNLERFISFGSQAEYGSINGRINESHPLRPNTAYGAAKVAALSLLDGFARLHKMPYVWLRLFSIYGPGEAETWFIPNLIRQMREGLSPQLSGCEQRYDYLHVHDLARGVLAVLRKPDGEGVFHLTSNKSVQLKQVVQLVKEVTGCRAEPRLGELPYRPGQSMHMEGDSSRFYRSFEFAPKIPLDQGLRGMVVK